MTATDDELMTQLPRKTPMTDWKALCVELFKACETLYNQSVTASHHQTITLSNGEHPIPISSDMLAQDAVFGDLLRHTRAALAELASDGPAVPESREPASVAGKSSDENCWQWYTYCPEEGPEMYSDRKQAQSAAQSIMGSYEVAAHSDGWHEDMELVSWGMLVPVEQAQVVERKTAEPDDEFDEWVKYELRPVRWGHQPAPPAEGEVGELAAKLRRLAPQNLLGIADPTITRAAELLQQQQAKIESLEQQLETERMRVVACGIIAMSDTPLSASKNRNCDADYWSASADDIARQIDELMRLRAQQTPGLVSEREATAIEALKRLRRWGRLSGGGYSADVVLGVVDWIDGGMEGPLPPLPAHALPLPQGEVE